MHHPWRNGFRPLHNAATSPDIPASDPSPASAVAGSSPSSGHDHYPRSTQARHKETHPPPDRGSSFDVRRPRLCQNKQEGRRFYTASLPHALGYPLLGDPSSLTAQLSQETTAHESRTPSRTTTRGTGVFKRSGARHASQPPPSLLQDGAETLTEKKP